MVEVACRRETEEFSTCVESSLPTASSAGAVVGLNRKGLATSDSQNCIIIIETG